MAASLEFYEISLRPLSALFSELSASWRGWEGERKWASLEDEIRLLATHDGLGKVTLNVELRNRLSTDTGPSWSATGLLHLDAGALDKLASAAEGFVALFNAQRTGWTL